MWYTWLQRTFLSALFVLWGWWLIVGLAQATVGWDPITGFGTPNFGKLREFVTFDFAALLGDL